MKSYITTQLMPALVSLALTALACSGPAHAVSSQSPERASDGSSASGKSISWGGCGITKKAFMKELADAFATRTGVAVNLQGGGATNGIRKTADGEFQMGGSCRMTLPEADRRELLVELYPVAWDALAIIVHKDNPLTNISAAEVKGILTGEISNWQQLGGDDAPIHSYSRNGTLSGVGYATRQYLFQDHSQVFDTTYSVKSSGPLEKAVEKDVLAIGITGVSSARRRDVKIAGLDGIEPSYENVRDGHYMMYRPLYLVAPAIPSPEVVDFINFARSADAKDILRSHGTVPHGDALQLMKKMLVYGIGMK